MGDTMSEQRHTPGPWFVDPRGVDGSTNATIGIFDHDWAAQPMANGVNFIAMVAWQGPDARGAQAANAAFIVRACNAHDDLLEALWASAAAWRMMGASLRNNEYCLDKAEKAEAAIAKALPE
jgi:hypothetical protein